VVLEKDGEYTVFARVISAPAYFAHPNFLKDDFGFIFAPRGMKI
jgi:hypothetical protein